MLERLLEAEPPPSIEEVARACGAHPNTLRDYHGALIRRLSVRRAEYRKAKKRGEVEAARRAALEEEPPPTMAEVSTRIATVLGVRSTTVPWTYFPDLCRRIASRHAETEKQKALGRRSEREVAVRAAVQAVVAEGEDPTYSRVHAALPERYRHTYASTLLIKQTRERGLA